jgi:hypothetical protein
MKYTMANNINLNARSIIINSGLSPSAYLACHSTLLYIFKFNPLVQSSTSIWAFSLSGYYSTDMNRNIEEGLVFGRN